MGIDGIVTFCINMYICTGFGSDFGLVWLCFSYRLYIPINSGNLVLFEVVPLLQELSRKSLVVGIRSPESENPPHTGATTTTDDTACIDADLGVD